MHGAALIALHSHGVAMRQTVHAADSVVAREGR